jgi:hypothetical protein
MSNLSELIGGGGGGGSVLEATASGALANGDIVIVNSDGTVSITQQNSTAIGSPTLFAVPGGTQTTEFISCVFDSNSNKVVISFSDGSQSFYGKSIVGTVSGTTISFGTAVIWRSTSSDWIGSAFDSNSNKVVIAYNAGGGSTDDGYAIVGTVSGTSISFGTAVLFDNGNVTDNYKNQGVVFDSNSNKIVIFYNDETDGDDPHGIVGTVSGTSISFGSPLRLTFNRIIYNGAIFDSASNKIVFYGSDTNNSNYGTAIVCTVSGTSLSKGTPVVFDSTGDNLFTSGAFDASTGKVVIAFNQNDGYAIVGTVSGTTISFGTRVQFNAGQARDISAVYDPAAEKVTIAFNDGVAGPGYLTTGTVSGTTISFNGLTQFESGKSVWISTAFDSNSDKVVIGYQDGGYFTAGTCVVYGNAYNTLKAENYIGISDGAYSDGATATVQIVGSVDDAQSGLSAGRAYYVQTDGTLSRIPDDPSVFAGTAVSSTQLIIKG